MKRTVKYILCLILILGMLSTFVACGDDITGHYELVKVTMADQTYTIQEFRALVGNDVEMFVELNADGTGKMAFVNNETDIEWKGNQLWSVQDGKTGVKANFTLEDGVLTLDISGMIMVFQK